MATSMLFCVGQTVPHRFLAVELQPKQLAGRGYSALEQRAADYCSNS